MLAYAGSEYQTIHAAERRRHCANCLFDAMDVHVDCEVRVRAGPSRGEKFAHIRRDSGDSEQPRLVVEAAIEIVDVQSISQKINQHSGVHGAAARTHHAQGLQKWVAFETREKSRLGTAIRTLER